MPQVAARISADQERWLKEYFKTKSAGAEFILPWAVDTFFRSIKKVKEQFSENELKVLIAAHKDIRLQSENARTSYLRLRLADACELAHVDEEYGVDRKSLDAKIQELSDTQSTALMVWASAYWLDSSAQSDKLEAYIRNC